MAGGPQVGKRIRLIVVGDPDTAEDDEEGIPLTVLFNPQFVAMSEESVSGWEGCLSIPEVRGVVPRSVEVTVSGYDRLGAPQSLVHAISLLASCSTKSITIDGTLFLDRMQSLDTLTYLEEYQRYWLAEE